MNLLDQAAILKYRRDRLATYGPGAFYALGWKTPIADCRGS
jgi:hypothetical protein